MTSSEHEPATVASTVAGHHPAGALIAERYPEVGAGGFTRVDGMVAFYTRVHALLGEDDVVLDFGAGRGLAAEDPVPFRRRLRRLQGARRRVVGVDIDPVVLRNPLVDEAYVIEGGRIPVGDRSVDVIVAMSVFEHLENPVTAARELDRVLRPGGWLCAKTPNRWGYIAVGARLVPNRLHTRALRRLQPHREPADVFPTYYRLNTRRDIARHFPRYDHFVTATTPSRPTWEAPRWPSTPSAPSRGSSRTGCRPC